MEASTAKERIHTLDVIRGAAVFGILLVNMRFFSSSLEVLRWRLSRWPEWWNAAAELFIDVFVAGRFLSIFAFLFGYGMIMMQERAEAAGRPFARIYARRLATGCSSGSATFCFIMPSSVFCCWRFAGRSRAGCWRGPWG